MLLEYLPTPLFLLGSPIYINSNNRLSTLII
jgi:hypothetical protein